MRRTKGPLGHEEGLREDVLIPEARYVPCGRAESSGL